MDGLRSLIGVLVTACLCQASTAAEAQPQPQTAPATCAVVGDVARPNTWHCPAAAPLTLRDALSAAGLASEHAQVLIIRTVSAHQWTELVSRSSSDSGPPLRAGDVVVVTSTSPLDNPVPPNAAFVLEGRPLVLSLQPSEQVPVAVGDVLSSCRLPLERVADLRLVSAVPGRSQPHLQPALPIQHGDVLVAGHASSRGVTARQRFAPLVTEWNSAMRPTSGPTPTSNPPAGQGITAAGSTPAADSPTGLMLPGATAAATATPAAPAVAPLSTPELAPAPHSPTTLPAQPADALPPAVPVTPFRTISQTQAAAHDASLPPASTLLNETLSNDNFELPGSDLALAESTAEASAELSAESTAGSTLWNLVFAGGLLTAAALIIIGWMRSEADMRQAQARAVQEGTSPPPADSLRQHSQAAVSLDASTTAAAVAEHVTPATQAAATQSTAVDSGPLIARGEWFSGDWLKASAAPPQAMPTPPVPAASAETATPAAAAVPIASTSVSPPLPTWLSGATTVQAVQSAAHQALDNWSATQSQRSRAAEAVQPVAAAQPAAAASSVTAAQIQPAATGTAAETFHDLNDLIENRLPVDLCAARMPLRVNLFGRPAGPQRLRIDAAHTQLAGPHMSLGADRRRMDAPQTVTAGAAPGPAANVARGERVPAGEQQGAAADVPVAPASLDRALHFLNEQGN